MQSHKNGSAPEAYPPTLVPCLPPGLPLQDELGRGLFPEWYGPFSCLQTKAVLSSPLFCVVLTQHFSAVPCRYQLDEVFIRGLYDPENDDGSSSELGPACLSVTNSVVCVSVCVFVCVRACMASRLQ